MREVDGGRDRRGWGSFRLLVQKSRSRPDGRSDGCCPTAARIELSLPRVIGPISWGLFQRRFRNRITSPRRSNERTASKSSKGLSADPSGWSNDIVSPAAFFRLSSRARYWSSPSSTVSLRAFSSRNFCRAPAASIKAYIASPATIQSATIHAILDAIAAPIPADRIAISIAETPCSRRNSTNAKSASNAAVEKAVSTLAPVGSLSL